MIRSWCCIVWLVGLGAAVAAAKPNVILIMADDLGYGDIGCYGSTLSKTPRLDALAVTGMRATDFHSNGAVCSPTRAALMTGRYQQRSGLEGVVTAAGHRHTGLDLKEFTIAELMKEGGYTTAMFGKWHLGYDPAFNPVKQGFDEFRGFVSGNIDLFSHIDQTGRFDWWVQDQMKDELGYMTELITDHGLNFIKRNKEKPFFLYLAHAAPHYPYQGPNDKGYRKIGDPKPILGIVKDKKRAYREMIESMDTQVGRIVDLLDAEGLRENTLIVFISDNGAVSPGDNGPLAGKKGTLMEGGHRVPGIFNWEGTIKPSTSAETMLCMDLMPTFASLANVSIQDRKLDGLDLSSVLRLDEKLPRRLTFWAKRGETAVRDGAWKLLRIKEANRLYDLSTDLGEKKNVAAKHPEIVDRLSKALDTWNEDVRKGVVSRTK